MVYRKCLAMRTIEVRKFERKDQNEAYRIWKEGFVLNEKYNYYIMRHHAACKPNYR